MLLKTAQVFCSFGKNNVLINVLLSLRQEEENLAKNACKPTTLPRECFTVLQPPGTSTQEVMTVYATSLFSYSPEKGELRTGNNASAGLSPTILVPRLTL